MLVRVGRRVVWCAAVALLTQSLVFLNFQVQSLTNSFDSASLALGSRNPQEAMDFNVTFRVNRAIGSNEEIVIRLPRFTQNLESKNFSITYNNISYGDVIVAPSYIWDAAWIEGPNEIFDDSDSSLLPYRSSELRLRTRFNGTLAAGTQSTVTVFKENKIGPFCGFASSQAFNLTRNLVFPFKKFEILTMQTRVVNVSNVLYNVTVFQNDTKQLDFWDGVGEGCAQLSSCNLQGQCDYCFKRCHCFKGFGSAEDLITTGRDIQPDCSSRVCPAGNAIADFPTSSNKAHAPAECSNRGTCNRDTGQCVCASPFTGAACDRLSCPNGCSGHGRCLSMAEIARKRAAVNPTAYPFVYGSTNSFSTTAWDFDTMYGCVCDSSWEVGYSDGQIQLSEYFGGDCSLKRCPSGDNPFTSIDETDCTGVSQLRRAGVEDPEVGAFNNKCYVACSNRGTCDYKTGACSCYPGSWGVACENIANTGGEALNFGRNLTNATIVLVQAN